MSSDLKVTNIKHASSGSNNLVLASDGTTSVSGALTASGGVKIANGGNIGSTSDTDAISISSAGVVTKSAQPYFNAVGMPNNVSSTEYFRFNAPASGHNVGSHFTQGTGRTVSSCSRFVVPVSGIYLFTGSITANASTTNPQHFYSDFVFADDNSGTGETIIARLMNIKESGHNTHVQINWSWAGYIDSGKYVKLKHESGQDVIAGGNHTWWTGVLLG